MKQLTLLVLIGLSIVGILACGGETAEPTDSPAPTVAPTQPPVVPTDPPEPTDTPAPTPEPTDTPVPAPTATNVPEPTDAPDPIPTATAAPEPTATPEPTAPATLEPDPTATLEPTAPATPEPTAAPTPEPTAEPELPIAADLAPMGANLRFLAYLDRASQKWFVYDATGDFKPEDLPLPPQAEAPDPSEIGTLNELVAGQIYTFIVNEQQTVEFENFTETFYPGRNDIPWR